MNTQQATPQPGYFIFSRSEGDEAGPHGAVGAFWSNEHGWTSLVDATCFTSEERAKFAPPTSSNGDATWMTMDEAVSLVATGRIDILKALRAQGYAVEPSRSQSGRFRWWRATGSDGASVPEAEVSEQTFASEFEAWRAALKDRETVFGPIEPAGPTKLVQVRLAAFTRVECTEVVEVPANITEAELQDLVNQRYKDVDGGDYVSDPDYWERAHCYATDATPGDEPTLMAFRVEGGMHIERAYEMGDVAEAPRG